MSQFGDDHRRYADAKSRKNHARTSPITRASGTNTYPHTSDGLRIAVLYTKVHDRLLKILTAANTVPAPLPLGQALRVIDTYFG